MSAASLLAFEGFSRARSRVQALVVGLRAAASGEVLDRAAAKVQALVDGASRAIIARHTDTGYAAGVRAVTRAAGLIQLALPRYANMHRWNPFRNGMPPFILKQGAVIFAGELRAALGDDPGGEVGALADEVLGEAAASAAKKAERARAAAERRAARRAAQKKGSG